ncbi:MAG: FmdB family zinc ribbon protein [Pyrinomonadaceae bacterium]
MPIYEYSCQKCKAHIEIMRKVSDKPLTRHAKCGGKLEKEWSQTSFQLKGSGWYVTDYAGKKSDAKEKKGEAATPSETKAETKAETKTDAKPKGDGAKSSAAAPKSTASKSSGD